jgi:hypothetical protein
VATANGHNTPQSISLAIFLQITEAKASIRKAYKWDGDVIHSGACRSQPKAAIGYRRSDNKITAADDGVMVAALGELFAHIDWPPVLER